MSNDATESLRKMTGVDSWTSSNNPVEAWRDCRAAIQYINLFLANVDKVNWNSDETVRAMYEQRYIGEAKGLRALFMYYLLRAHGGWANGTLLGVPNILEPTDVNSDFNSLEVRASFADCMKQLIEDAEEAVRVLPVDYKDTDNETMTVSCLGKSYTVTKATYNRVLGSNFAGRLSGRIARAVLAQATLMAASPAFADGSGVTYEQAAKYAKQAFIAGTCGLSLGRSAQMVASILPNTYPLVAIRSMVFFNRILESTFSVSAAVSGK